MKYRNNCIHPTVLNALWAIDKDTFYKVNLVVATAKHTAKHGTYEEYRNWIDAWRGAYSDISRIIGYIKDVNFVRENNGTMQEQALALNAGRLLANTLLNARQYVKDVRRGIRERNND